jgi:SAM-dependent methyltransferase
MSVFAHYARYYDLLYKDKDYSGETEYVHYLLQKFGRKTKSILELGCGTGKHAMLLAEKGYTITGIDMSEQMLKSALNRNSKDTMREIEFKQGDIRTIRLERKFDAVISLFHVFSYQITNDDLIAAIATAKTHLNSNGIFIFDAWYGPAVLTDKPVVRVKRLEDDLIKVVRIAEPKLHPNENIVDVNYTTLIENKDSGKTETIKEKHRMRYLFRPEIEICLKQEGLTILHSEEWMSKKGPDCSTWGVVFICKNV